MTKITGYARQKDPKWLYFSIVIFVVVIISFVLYAFFAVYSWMESENLKKLQAEAAPTTTTIIASEESTTTTTTMLITPIAGVRVEKITFTSKINEGNRPADDLTKISLKEEGTVYCHTRVDCSSVPAVIRHVWINPSGAVAADVKLNISRRPADTWSYISLQGAKPGKWEMRVVTADGRVVGKGYLTVVND